MIKICCISDTHMQHDKLDMTPYLDSDILLHAGDASSRGTKTEMLTFLEWFSTIPIKHKIFIAGNHCRYIEKDPEDFREMLTHFPTVTYLEGTSTTVEGLKIYGEPQQPAFCNWAFNRTYNELQDVWDNIPKDTDILLTHTPPQGILDKVNNNYSPTQYVGCPSLLEALKKHDIKLHVFGHIHTQGGKTLKHGTCTYVNASVLDDSYTLVNKPIILEIK